MGMDESRGKMATIAPEIRLIGWLLLFGGILGALRGSVYLWQAITISPLMFWAIGPDAPGLSFPQGAPPHLLVLIFEGLFVVLNLAGIIAGIGLLRHKHWARRMAVVTLIGLIAAVLLPTQIENVRTFLLYAGDGMLKTRILPWLWMAFLTLFYPLTKMVMLVFLESRRALVSWDEMSEQPDRLQAIAQGVLKHFSTPPVVSLIALLLICQAMPAIFVVWQNAVSLFHQTMVAQLISQGTIVITPVLTILAGLCLLRQIRGATVLAVIVMAATILYPIVTILILSPSIPSVFGTTDISKILPAIMLVVTILLLSLSFPAVMIRYLLAHRKPASPPTPASCP